MRVDLLLVDRKDYTYENDSAQKIAAVLKKKNIPHKKIFFSDGILRDYIHYLERDPPTGMVSFAPLLPHAIPFCDIVQIPQFHWAMSSISGVAHFLDSKYGKIGLPTPSQLSKIVHLPHGVESVACQKSLFDVVFFSPLVDVNCLTDRWKEYYSDNLIRILDQALVFAHQGVCVYEAVKNAWCSKEYILYLGHMIGAVEDYLRAKRAYQVITCFKEAYIDVFGEHIGSNWYLRLPNAEHVRLHAKLPFRQHFQVLAQSKITLLDPLDRIWQLPAAAASSLPLMIDQEDLHDQIAMYLADSRRREEALKIYKDQIYQQNWEKQTDKLIEYLYDKS